MAAEKLGRTELVRRMAVALSAVEVRARAHDPTTVAGASLEHAQAE